MPRARPARAGAAARAARAARAVSRGARGREGDGAGGCAGLPLRAAAHAAARCSEAVENAFREFEKKFPPDYDWLAKAGRAKVRLTEQHELCMPLGEEQPGDQPLDDLPTSVYDAPAPMREHADF